MSTRRTLLTRFMIAFWAVPVLAEVTTSEFFSHPTAEGWTLLGQQGDVTTWVAEGVYYQDLPHNCSPGPVCDLEALRRSIEAFNGRSNWFYEYRCSATSDHIEIPAGAPAVLAIGNFAGNNYHATLSSDRIKLSGDADLPIQFLDVEPGVPHTIRLELFNDPPPATFHWYVDSILVLEGLADSPFPDFDSRVTWQGETWQQPTLNAWYYIRFGDIPLPASGDFDSNGAVDSFDQFYFAECLDRSAAGEPAYPSCSWADMDAGGSVDCGDWEAFRAAWTGAEPPAPIPACAPPAPGVSPLGTLALAAATLGTGIWILGIHRPRHPLAS